MIRKVANLDGETLTDGDVLLLVSRSTYAGLAAAVEVAYDDPESVPDEFAEIGAELEAFFRTFEGAPA